MFNVGDLVVYSTHGICQIDNICDKTYSGVTRTYYVMHPMEEPQLTIHNPIDNKRVRMQGILDKNEAKEILETFSYPGIAWIEKASERTRKYDEIVKSGNRKDIIKLVKTLMQKKVMIEAEGKKLSDPDRRLLSHVQHILFKELAISLETTVEFIHERVVSII